MISSVSFEKTEYNELPHKFEAGTPNIAGGIGLGAAIDYLHSIGYAQIQEYEEDLLSYTLEKLKDIEGLRLIGEADKRAAVISFLIGDIHPTDVGTILDKLGIAVRTGHHCCQPVMTYFKVPATTRASFAIYNTKDEVDKFVNTVKKVIEVFA